MKRYAEGMSMEGKGMYYVTFGQIHVHRVNGRTFDCDTVAVIDAVNLNAAREDAFRLFGDRWHQCEERMPDMSYYPRGLVGVDLDADCAIASFKPSDRLSVGRE